MELARERPQVRVTPRLRRAADGRGAPQVTVSRSCAPDVWATGDGWTHMRPPAVSSREGEKRAQQPEGTPSAVLRRSPAIVPRRGGGGGPGIPGSGVAEGAPPQEAGVRTAGDPGVCGPAPPRAGRREAPPPGRFCGGGDGPNNAKTAEFMVCCQKVVIIPHVCGKAEWACGRV